MSKSQNNGKPKSTWLPPTHVSWGVTAQIDAPVNDGQLDHRREKKQFFQTLNAENDGWD